MQIWNYVLFEKKNQTLIKVMWCPVCSAITTLSALVGQGSLLPLPGFLWWADIFLLVSSSFGSAIFPGCLHCVYVPATQCCVCSCWGDNTAPNPFLFWLAEVLHHLLELEWEMARFLGKLMYGRPRVNSCPVRRGRLAESPPRGVQRKKFRRMSKLQVHATRGS